MDTDRRSKSLNNKIYSLLIILRLLPDNILKKLELEPELLERFAKRSLEDPDFLEAVKKGDVEKLEELNSSIVNSNERTKQEFEDLAKDPAHNGSVSTKTLREREVGLNLEKQGKLKKPIRRDPNPAGGEFIDGDGKIWDIKAFNSNFPPNKGGFTLESGMKAIKKELAKGENIIVDTDLKIVDIQSLKNSIAKEGLNDKVIFY